MDLVYGELLTDLRHLLLYLLLLGITVTSVPHDLMEQLLLLREFFGQELPPVPLIEEVVSATLFANHGITVGS